MTHFLAAQLVQPDVATAGLDYGDTAQSLADALGTLPEAQQQLLTAIIQTGGSVEQAARLLGLRPGQRTYQRLYRARCALLRALKQMERDRPD